MGGMMRAGAMAGAALLAAGCAGGESSGVVALGPDAFVIENRGGILPGVVERTLEQAAAFCAGQGAQAEMLSTRVNPSSYQVAFRCSGRMGAAPVTAVAQAPGQPPTAARTRPVLEPGERRRRGRVVAAPDWAADPRDMPAFVSAPPPAMQPQAAWSANNPFAATAQPPAGVPWATAQPPAGVPWATAQQAAPFAAAIPTSVFTPAPMPVIAPAPEGTTRRLRAGRAADRAFDAAPAPAPAPVPMGAPMMGVPLAPAAAPMPAGLPAPDQVPGLLPPQGLPPAAAARPAALAPVAGPVFQPSPNPLPGANAPLSAAPPAGFWQLGR